jgi:hypothetical protein
MCIEENTFNIKKITEVWDKERFSLSFYIKLL